ncbi:MAG: flagellar protein FlgN [Phycisphaerales bacterium]
MTKSADPTRDSFRKLESVLAAQLEEYRTMRGLIERRRDALRHADAAALRKALDAEHAAIVRIGELDRARGEVAGALARRLGIGGNVTMSALAARAHPDVRESLEVVAAALRDEVDACRRASSVVRAAADALAQHVSGVMQTVQQAFASAHTYGRAGRLAGAVPIRSIDLRS